MSYLLIRKEESILWKYPTRAAAMRDLKTMRKRGNTWVMVIRPAPSAESTRRNGEGT